MSKELKSTTKHIRVYRQPKGRQCPNCKILENLLTVNNIEFDSINLITAEAMTEMAVRHMFPMYTPILQVDNDVYYRELWLVHGKTLNIPRIKKIVDSSKMDWKDIEDTNIICEGDVCKI